MEAKLKNNNSKKVLSLTYFKNTDNNNYYIRGGQKNLGCGWCGHSNPEG